MAILPITLPNGMKAHYLREEEVPILYKQVQEYVRNGIELLPGDTLFDVGANIGLFSLWSYEQCQRDLNIYAFEPIPVIFDVLKRNAQLLDPATMKVFSCGLAQEPKTVVFGYYPNATALSTAYPDAWKQTRAIIQQAIDTALSNPSDDEPSYIRRLRRLPPVIRPFLIRHKLNQAFQVKLVSCPMRTISNIIREYQVQRIDLLKIDVERSELDVLLGIEPQDWHKIKQMVIEVHNEEQRVDQVTALLRQYGLSEITIEQEPSFKDSDIFNVYASRKF